MIRAEIQYRFVFILHHYSTHAPNHSRNKKSPDAAPPAAGNKKAQEFQLLRFCCSLAGHGGCPLDKRPLPDIGSTEG
jgi:hypothetical protein